MNASQITEGATSKLYDFLCEYMSDFGADTVVSEVESLLLEAVKTALKNDAASTREDDDDYDDDYEDDDYEDDDDDDDA